ncbi:MAG: hypothetical protein EKK48_12520 [Candidatus Melainabacteria bacterium]|nr:MAG: hypothetical protein EKK48_12520 [Candidatus Melainabacteria bacterium]
MGEKIRRLPLLSNQRARMSACIQLSVMFHAWVFSGFSANAQAQAIRSEKAQLMQALAYARRAGIDISTYQKTLKEPPFEAGFENRPELARAAHSLLEQMLDQVSRQLSNGDPDVVAANRDGILIVDSGDSKVASHSLLVRRDGSVQYTIDNNVPGLRASGQQYRFGGKTGSIKISTAQAARLFELTGDGGKLYRIAATALLPDRDDGNFLIPQMVYVDYNDNTSPNLLCASNEHGKELAECCKSIQASTQINKLAQIKNL